ncbi:MAG: DUF721 domain-containing protein [Candidatus Melainabacteria bacterium]|nr:DUF721 domain-containing protein [Candidatus Melainabacteria bacterium]
MPEDETVRARKPDRYRSRSTMTDVSTVLSKVISKFGLEQRMKEHAFMSLWADIVDPPFKNVTRPLFIDNEGNLVVSVKDASVAQELSFQRGPMLKRLAPFARGVGLKIVGIRFDLKHFKAGEDSDYLEKALQSHKREEARAASFVASEQELASIQLSEENLIEIQELKESLQAGVEFEPGISDRMVRMYERELRLRAWRETKGLDACTQCGFVDTRMYGELSLCRLCHVWGLINAKHEPKT